MLFQRTSRILLASALSLFAVFAAATESAHDTSDWHTAFDAVLKRHVMGGYVDYGAIANDARFDQYIEFLKAPLPAKLTREQQLEYWINAYNALSIRGILDGHSPDSLFGRWRFFKGIDYTVGGKTINLYDLERDIIVPFGEPRTHFAIVCASRSCPPLRSEAFDAARLDTQLDDQARKFLNNRALNRYDDEQEVAYLSKIFDWYEGEFVSSTGSVQKFIAPYVEDPSIRPDLAAMRYRVKHLEYDWSLNGSEP